MNRNGIPGLYNKLSDMITGNELKIWQYNFIIAVSAAILFLPFLGGVHLFDWDEINFAESAREMIESGDYLTVQINFVPFWEKPPLFIWMQVLSMKIFGINEFSARFPNALCGITSLLVLFNTGRKLFNIRFGILWIVFYATSLLPFFYFKSGIIDPWFNLFIFLGLYQAYQYFNKTNHTKWHAAGSAVFIGLAILTKGPVALLIFMIAGVLFLTIKKFRVNWSWADMLIFVTVLSVTGGLWFILQIFNGHFSIISDFIVYQIRLFKTKDAGHGGFLFYHFVVLFAGVFPASVFALPSLFGSRSTQGNSHGFYQLMLITFWVVLLLFTIVKTKIVHYSSLCYFPLTFLAAWGVYNGVLLRTVWRRIIFILTVTLSILTALVISILTFTDKFKYKLIDGNLIKDTFALENLKADGGWKGYEFLVGLIIVAGLVIYVWHWLKRNDDKALYYLGMTLCVFMFLAMLFIVPRVERYSQHAAIEFFQSVSHQDAYLETVGYKSYTHLFYGKVKQQENSLYQDENWLLTGNIDKPLFVAIKITRKDKFMKQYPDMVYLYEKNGFVFFKRNPF